MMSLRGGIEMTNMRLPLFSAEAALSKTVHDYHVTTAFPAVPRTRDVVTQMRPEERGCFQYCLWGGSSFAECWWYCAFER